MHHTDILAAAQREAEQRHAQEGAERYLERQSKKEKAEGYERRDEVQKMIRGAIPILAGSIRSWVEAASAKKGRPSAALSPLKSLDADLVALNALSHTFNTVARDLFLTDTAIAIGRAIQVELEALMIETVDPKAAEKFLAMAEGESSVRAMKKRHEALADKLKVGLEWARRTQALVGRAVIHLILRDLGDVFDRVMITNSKGTTPALRFTPIAIEAMAGMKEAAAWMRPLLKPMIVEPRPWTHYDTGAYLELRLSKTVPMVRTHNREAQKLIREAIKDGSMAEELEALNGIQATRFAIDGRVLEVMKQIKEEARQPGKSFPMTTLPDLPAKIEAELWDAMSQEARTAMSRRRKSVRNIRAAAGTNGQVFKADIEEAERLYTAGVFYLPHSMDFRGRVYAVPHFNPQRSDHVKALFQFADPVPMGEEGGYWLAIHLANCGDFAKVSKKSFDDRLAWVSDNEPAILQTAADPMGMYGWWSEADSPFCFLQACFEYADWAASGYSEDFLGHISVALDGSCSGLQHYSAMTRSAEEGYHVNLLPRETPGDIYMVAHAPALASLEALTHNDGLAGLAASTILSQGFGRSDVKRNVMTYFYGSERFGMRDQHIVDTMRPLADDVALGKIAAHPYALMTERTNKDTGEVTSQLDGGFTCAQVLANVIYGAIVSVAPKADEASQWFQKVAQLLAHESLPVIWRTPTGLPVVQRYSEYTSKRVNMWLYDRAVDVPKGDQKLDEQGNGMSRIECLIREAPTKRIDKKKARSAISPNKVHSLDGSHLKRTVVFALREGITHFQLIHDSFATHAGNTGRFFRIIREAFVDMYENYCPFEALEEYAMSVLSPEGQEKIPPRPSKGNLDLRAILDSEYAFA